MRYLLAVLVTFGVVAKKTENTFYLDTLITKGGQYVQVVNNTDRDLKCWILIKGKKHKFTVRKYATSLWKPKPKGIPVWECK